MLTAPLASYPIILASPPHRLHLSGAPLFPMKYPLLGGLALALACCVYAAEPAPPAGDIESIEPLGLLVRECTLPGETRRDDVVPRHANALQLSATRWLVLYSTHGYRGVDDERSIVYQVRSDAPD